MSYPHRGNQHFNKKRKKPIKNPNLNAAMRPALSVVPQSYNLKERFSNFAVRYIAPHHDEPEDLTDDLAPKVSGPSAALSNQAAAQSSQPGSAGSDNKLNFKFQKTKPKTPDWSMYQNNFKRLSAASPDIDSEEVQGENEQKPQNIVDQQTKKTEVNTGFDEDVEMKDARELTTSDLSIAVTLEPFRYITAEQVKQVADALANQIQNAILKNDEYVPAFQHKPVRNLGYLPLTCQSAYDLLWLHETIAKIPSPIPNSKLTIKPPRSIPQFIKIGIFLPNFSGTLEELKNLLKQNHWYDMDSWMLINSHKQGDDPAGYHLTYCVPENQAHIINNKHRRMAYSLGTVFINIYSKQWNEKLKNSEKDFHFRNVAKHLLVCVVSEPFNYLTLMEVELIRLALNYRLEKAVSSEAAEYIPNFRGNACHYKGGLRVWCESDRDLKWLKDSVACLPSPVVGSKLIVIEQSDVPERVKARIFIPSTEDEAVVLKVLKYQNRWCDLNTWALFSTKKCAAGVLCVFYIPIEQMRIIKKERRCNMSFLLGEVSVKFDSCY